MNKHLNIFNFFNNDDKQFVEDNLSRAFAICLQNDNQLLDNVLKRIVPENLYQDLFNTDEPSYNIEIDVQQSVSDLSGYTNIIAVACSDNESLDFESITPNKTDNPITDVCITIRDMCILFEFKRSSANPVAQLKGQALKAKENSDDSNEIVYINFSWKEMVKLTLNVLSFQKQINNENKFTKDFKEFIEKKYPHWFPHRLLKNIEYPQDKDGYRDTKNHFFLNRRLNSIKDQIFGSENTKSIGNRYVIIQDYGWAKEINLSYNERKECLHINIYPGDTKRQGHFFYKPSMEIFIPETINGYEVYYEPYLKFSHFNSGLFWIHPQEKFPQTHSFEFFKRFAGRWKKERWEQFKKGLNEVLPDWSSNKEWINKIENSNRTYFDLSVGIYIAVYLPYKTAQELDNDNLNSNLANEIRKIITELKAILDK